MKNIYLESFLQINMPNMSKNMQARTKPAFFVLDLLLSEQVINKAIA